MSCASSKQGFLICPEFLSALARLLAHEGLPLSALAEDAEIDSTGHDETCIVAHSDAVLIALRRGLESESAAESYAAESLLKLKAQERLRDEPPVAMRLASAPIGSLWRLLVPGAIILGVDSRCLQQGPAGVKMLDVRDLAPAAEPSWSAEGARDKGASCDTIDVVIREVAYKCDGSPGELSQLPCALRVEVLVPPDVSASGEQAADCAGCWADFLCNRCASAVFIAPAFHAALASLLASVDAELVHLSARNGASRGELSAKLVRLARKLYHEDLVGEKASVDVTLCLAAASGSSPVSFGNSQLADPPGISSEDAECGHRSLLLLQGRDVIPSGALLVGATVDRTLGHGVALSLGSSSLRILDGRRDHSSSLILTRKRLPRGKAPVSLPSVGTSLACLLLERSSSEPGPTEELVPSLVDSPCAELEDLLARQVGLKMMTISVPESGVDRVRACRALLETCGTSIRLEVDLSSSHVRITGVPHETDKAIELAKSLRGRSLEVSERAAWRIIGRGGSGIRQLEQDSGAWIRVNTEAKPHTVEIFGEASAVQRVETLIQARHASITMEVKKQLAPRIMGKGGVTKREIETTSGGVSLHINFDLEPCIVEVLGEAAAVDRAVILIREHLAADRIEVPRRVVPHIIGKKGCTLRELEAASNAFLNVVSESDPCFVEISGSRACKDKAYQLLQRVVDQHSYDSFKVSRDITLHVLGRRGSVLREIEATTGASLRADSYQDPCLVEAFGDKVSVQAAMDLLRSRSTPCRCRVTILRYMLPYVLGRAGSGTQEIEASTGASLHVDMRDSDDGEQQCVVEILGHKEQVERARELLEGRLQHDSIDVPASSVSRVIGRGGTTIRSIQASTSAMIHIPDKHGDMCRIEIFGAAEARSEARNSIEDLVFGPMTPMRNETLQHHADDEHDISASVVQESHTAEIALQPHAPPHAMEVVEAEDVSPEKTTEVKEIELDRSCHGSGNVLAGLQIPDELLLRRSAALPWAWRMPVCLDSPKKPSEDEAAHERVCESIQALSAVQSVSDACGELHPGAATDLQEPDVLALPGKSSRHLVRKLSRLSRGLAKRQRLRRCSETRCSRRLSQVSSAPSCSSDSVATGADGGSAPTLSDLLRTDIAMDSATYDPTAKEGSTDLDQSALRCMSPTRLSLDEEDAPNVATTPTHMESDGTGARPLSITELIDIDATHHRKSIETPDDDWASKLPTPLREDERKRLHSALETKEYFPPTTRSVRQRVDAALSTCSPTPKSSSLFILDGLNIMKSRNTPLWNSWDARAPKLEWAQLEQACRYYISRGQKVSVYLPPLRPGHEEQLEACRQEFGDVFVSCCSASDDLFMINTVKLYEDAHRAWQDPTNTPRCRIVTNDRFEDWKRRGDMDSAWIDRHCVRFAFGPGRAGVLLGRAFAWNIKNLSMACCL